MNSGITIDSRRANSGENSGSGSGFGLELVAYATGSSVSAKVLSAMQGAPQLPKLTIPSIRFPTPTSPWYDPWVSCPMQVLVDTKAWAGLNWSKPRRDVASSRSKDQKSTWRNLSDALRILSLLSRPAQISESLSTLVSHRRRSCAV